MRTKETGPRIKPTQNTLQFPFGRACPHVVEVKLREEGGSGGRRGTGEERNLSGAGRTVNGGVEGGRSQECKIFCNSLD